jgi:GntR family transcriptional repressor for pyruvate dehydrogenase complex
MPIRAISRSNVHDDIRDRISTYIQENGLQPGDRLPGEETLATRLGVGRPAVREALRALEAVGAVETRKGVGRFIGTFAAASYIRNFTSEALVQSFTESEIAETRCLLEIAAIPEAVTRMTDVDLREIQDLLAGMRAKVEAGERHLDEDIGMHRVFMRHTENHLIATMLDAVYALMSQRSAANAWLQLPDRRERARIDLAEHTRLAEAVLARDSQLAQQRLIEHFDTTASRQGFHRFWHVMYGRQPSPTEGS